MLGIGIGLWNNVAAQSGGGGGPATAWNAATSNAAYAIGGTGNLTATTSANSAPDRLLRANNSHTEGYWEMVVPDTASGAIQVGFQTSSASTSTWVGNGGIGWTSSTGGIDYQGGTPATYATFASGDILAFAIKQTSVGVYKAFFGKWNGSAMVWQGSADPSSNTGGIDISAIIGTGLYPAADYHGTGSIVGRFTTGFSGSLPTGVAAWS